MSVQPDYQTRERMALKQRAIPIPDLRGKRVLDVGTDFGYWAAHAANNGAIDVLGLDRNRVVRGAGKVDLIARNRAVFKRNIACRFEQFEFGKEWQSFGEFDVVFLFSLYHHIYECTGGDHASIWYWLRRHVDDDGMLLWENPVDCRDSVVQRNVAPARQVGYSRAAIMAAAERYFDVAYHGPALHEPFREVWICRPRKELQRAETTAAVISGKGGATGAFLHAEERRSREISRALGWYPYPGSLNLSLNGAFDWGSGYYRASILDVADRGAGLESEWTPRWARFYPIRINSIGMPMVAFRFEGERYRSSFMEVIASRRLRDEIRSNMVTISRR